MTSVLRRDTEYVVTWNPRTWAWMARPVRCEDDEVVRAGVGFVEVAVVTPSILDEPRPTVVHGAHRRRDQETATRS